MYFIMFRLFKIDLFHKEMVFASILMSVISFFLRNVYGFTNSDVFIQIMLMFLLVWMLFRVHYFYSIVMTLTTYQVYMSLQVGLYYTMGYHRDNNLSIYILQIFTVILAIGLGMLIQKKRLGFDFIPDNPNFKLMFTAKDKVLFALTIPALFFLTATIYITENYKQVLYVLPIIHVVILISYLFISYRKDRSE